MSLKYRTPQPDRVTFRPPDAAQRPILEQVSRAPSEHPMLFDPNRASSSAVGLTWSHLLSTTSPPLEVRLRAIVEVLRALQPIHTNLVRPPSERCHGALNPRCVLVNQEGVASVFWQPEADNSQGYTSAYVAPEVRIGAEPDQQADIYAVGVMLYEALSGRHLGSEHATSRAGVVRPPPRPAHGNQCSWADPLYDVALRAMYQAPHERWDNALTFAQEIADVAGARVAEQQVLGDIVSQALSGKQRRTGALPKLGGPVVTGRFDDDEAEDLTPHVVALAVSDVPLGLGDRLLDIAGRIGHPSRLSRYALSLGVFAVAVVFGYWVGHEKQPPEKDLLAQLPSEATPLPRVAAGSSTSPDEQADQQAPTLSKSGEVPVIAEEEGQERKPEMPKAVDAELNADDLPSDLIPSPSRAVPNSRSTGKPVVRKRYEPEGI